MIIIDPLQGAWEIPSRLKNWGEQCSPPLENPCLSLINFERNPVDVMSIGRFLLPDFVEYQGGVFLYSQFCRDKFNLWSEKSNDISEIEKIINHVHVYDVFGYASDSTDDEFLQVANLMRRSWEIALKTSFPNDFFNISLDYSDQNYGPVVSFYKIRNNK